MTVQALGAAYNPFSTRFHAPGALPFQFDPRRGAGSAGEFLDRFLAQARRGEIVGPHGTGKTTLLRTLEPAARERGWPLRILTLRDGSSRLPPGWNAGLDSGAVVIVDGVEQLGRLAWWHLRWTCRRHAWGLLVTTHAPRGLPILYRTGVDATLAECLAARVLEGSPAAPRLVEPREVREALAAAGGDLREAFFRLYDRYEDRWHHTIHGRPATNGEVQAH